MFRSARSLKTPIQTLFLAALVVAPLGTRASTPVEPSLTVVAMTPNPAIANVPFTLYLTGTGGNCNIVYSRESVSVVGKQISLSYVAEEVVFLDNGVPAKAAVQKDTLAHNPLIYTCPVYALPETAIASVVAPIRANTPAFPMPALAVGEYSVSVSKLSPCMVATPACKMAVLPMSVGTLVVEPTSPKPYSYTITPASTHPEEAFELTLQSYDFNCGTTFDSLGVSVTGNAITLSFLDHANPAAICPAIYRPYGPTFKLPALRSGVYAVKSYRLPACYPCKMAGETAEAGSLTVTGDTKRVGWYLKESIVGPDSPFTMQLLNKEIGNCQTSFSHQGISRTGDDIHARFVMESHPERVCIQDMRPYGPAFEMNALKMGAYPVYADQLLPCEVEAPFCAVLRVYSPPVDTLVVAETFVTRLAELRAQAPKVEMRGSRAAFLLPEGIGGTWKAELVTVAGRQVRALTVTGEGGSRTEMDFGKDLKAGLYLLRLHGPDGDLHVLPIVKQATHE